MTNDTIHADISNKLAYFHKVHKIPNIVFHGPHGSGKRTILNKFIQLIYNNDNSKIKSYVMHVNCAYGKGIKFIREELKFFAKTHIPTNEGHTFKSVILLNADKLTTDAQSALRRCIELYNHTTRFFIVVEDKYKLLKPILSRFCEIYVYHPCVNGKVTNLCNYGISKTFNLKTYSTTRQDWLKKELTKSISNVHDLLQFSTKIYEKGYCALDIIKVIESRNVVFEKSSTIDFNKLLLGFDKVKHEIKHEKLCMYFILHFLYFDNRFPFDTISCT